jgi:hypothetical protein
MNNGEFTGSGAVIFDTIAGILTIWFWTFPDGGVNSQHEL